MAPLRHTYPCLINCAIQLDNLCCGIKKYDLLLVLFRRVVSTEEGKRLAEQWKGVFLETSAKENQKVADIFQTIIFEIEKAEGNIPEKGGCVLQ